MEKPSFFSRIILPKLGPILVSEISGLNDKNGVKKRGLLISLLSLPEQLFSDRKNSVKKIVAAARLAEKLGVEIIGLGALTSSVSSRGKLITKHVKKIGVTTGHAFTSIVVIKNLLFLAEKLNINLKKSTVTIVGAAGSVGKACTKLLMNAGVKKFILVDRKFDLLKSISSNFPADVAVEIYASIPGIKLSDIIITATNAPYAVLRSEMVRDGTIVLDDAQPSDLDESLSFRKNVITVEAGLIKLSEINTNFDFGLMNSDDIFGCLGETMVLSWNNWKGHYVIDEVSDHQLKEIDFLSRDIGFQQAPIRSFSKIFSDEDFQRIAKIRKDNGFN